MEKAGKRGIILLGVIWSLVWIYSIFTKYSTQSLYLFMSEFAVVFSIFILSTLLVNIKHSKSNIIKFIITIVVLGVLFGLIIHSLSQDFLVIIYLGLSILFNLFNFYFIDLEGKVSSFKLQLKNMIFLVISAVLGFGVLSIVIYHVIKVIERVLQLFGFELIRFGHKR